MTDKTIILASKSAIRQKILKNAGVRFVAKNANVDESVIKEKYKGRDPKDIVLALASAKAAAIPLEPDDIVIGADQVLVFENKIYDKPKSSEELRDRLLRLRGREHFLINGTIGLRHNEQPWVNFGVARLSMRSFSNEWLNEYLQRGGEALRQSVGGYLFEKDGVQLFDAVEGSYYSILGLPILPVLAFLRAAGAIRT